MTGSPEYSSTSSRGFSRSPIAKGKGSNRGGKNGGSGGGTSSNNKGKDITLAVFDLQTLWLKKKKN